jgi:hypothetical protein
MARTKVTIAAKTFIGVVIAAGTAAGGFALSHWNPHDVFRFSMFLILFFGAALLKGRIPGITGTYSPVFFCVLLGSHVLSFSEVVVLAGLAGMIQCTTNFKRPPSLSQVAFNAANMMVSTAAVFPFLHQEAPWLSGLPLMVLLLVGATVYYFLNTLMVAVVLALVETKRLINVCRYWCLGSLPYYLAGGLIAGVALNTHDRMDMKIVALTCPAMLLVTLYYLFWLGSDKSVRATAERI